MRALAGLPADTRILRLRPPELAWLEAIAPRDLLTRMRVGWVVEPSPRSGSPAAAAAQLTCGPIVLVDVEPVGYLVAESVDGEIGLVAEPTDETRAHALAAACAIPYELRDVGAVTVVSAPDPLLASAPLVDADRILRRVRADHDHVLLADTGAVVFGSPAALHRLAVGHGRVVPTWVLACLRLSDVV